VTFWNLVEKRMVEILCNFFRCLFFVSAVSQNRRASCTTTHRFSVTHRRTGRYYACAVLWEAGPHFLH
jgi:hypothetical protein